VFPKNYYELMAEYNKWMGSDHTHVQPPNASQRTSNHINQTAWIRTRDYGYTVANVHRQLY